VDNLALVEERERMKKLQVSPEYGLGAVYNNGTLVANIDEMNPEHMKYEDLTDSEKLLISTLRASRWGREKIDLEFYSEVLEAGCSCPTCSPEDEDEYRTTN